MTEILLYSTPNSVYAKTNGKYKKNERVIVSTENGLELGLIKNENVDINASTVEIVRRATAEDNKIHCENCRRAREILPEIKAEVDKLVPEMKVSFVTINHENTKITINYTAGGRVDFRELVKILGSKYKTRIEMRQIGDRDESKRVGAMGICGRETCCKAFLNDFDKVSIKMAKDQNIALNPTRINGMCGRLLCCLKYESEFYEEMKKKMPKNNAKVETPDGVGIVSSTDYLKETVSVTFTKDDTDTTEIKTYPLDDIKIKKN